jgi:hypothetical protein
LYDRKGFEKSRAIIDVEDIDKIKNYRWYESNGYVFHTVECEKRYNILMHRVIFDAQDGELVDHRNHNTLDNRKINLRKATYQDNNRNKTVENKQSKYAGVSYDINKDLWIARIKINNKNIHLKAANDKHFIEMVRLKAEQIVYKEFSPNYKDYCLLEEYEEFKNINSIEELRKYLNTKNKVGIECHWSKFTKEDIIHIRELYKQLKNNTKIADMYNVSKSTICRITKGESYKELI